jgi:hypothetical protein
MNPQIVQSLYDDAPAYSTSMNFFVPKPEFIQLIKTRFGRLFFADCGAGLGALSHQLTEAGLNGIAIDAFPSPEAVVPITKWVAQLFPFTTGQLPILARPCRGSWIRDTIDAAIHGSGQLLYIGLDKHHDMDIATLPYHKYKLAMNVGEDGECAWLITKEPINMSRKNFETIQALRIHYPRETTCLVGIKNGDKYWDMGMSRCTLMDGDIILRDYKTEYDAGASLDEIEAMFEQEFVTQPTPQEPSARLGWLAPNGNWFPCSYCCHASLAAKLAKLFVPKDEYYSSASNALQDRGWMQIMGCGLCSMGYVNKQYLRPTEEQLAVLGKIVQEFKLSKGENFNKILLQNPEEYSEQMWSTPPDGDGDIIEEIEQQYLRFAGETNKLPKNEDETLSKRLGAHPGD